jgi:hypothetical protein
MIDKDTLDLLLADYDQRFFTELEPVLTEIALKSKALASNLRRCLTKFRDTERYLKAYLGEPVTAKEAELEGEEFMIFREYVRLLRSCTIMCGNETSARFKKFFLEFFAGKRLELAKDLGLRSSK